MAGNRCYSSFLPLTNQVFQQPHSNNNYNQIPITQQLAADNQNHGFRGLVHQNDPQKFDQAEQQKRIWVDQQIGSHYQQCREKVLIDSNAVPEGTGSNSLPFFPAVNFSLGHNGNNENVVGVSGEDDEEDLVMRGSEQYHVFESRNTPSHLTAPPPHCWHTQEDSSIKQPTIWRPLFTELLNGNNKRCKIEAEEFKEEEHEQNQNKRFKCSEKALHVDEPRNILENKRKLAGDLEAVYGGSATDHETNQTYAGPVQEPKTFCGDGVETDTSKDSNNGNGREKSSWDNSQMESMAVFFKSLVDRIMEHQESLHRRFLDTIERLDGERRERDEEWRRQEFARLNQEAISRAHDQALASSREAIIVSYLEKVVGQGIIQLPNKIAQDSDILSTKINKRWPKVEVEALIRVRTSLEPKFHDVTSKAFVWEEISKIMVSMGYKRSAQRCKEKWENINRYFKKAKENSALQCPKKHKACPYFEQLNEFHSTKSLPNGSNCASPLSLSSNLQGKSIFATGSFKEIQHGCNIVNDKELNHQLEGNKDEEAAEDEEEDDDEGSADD